jgi:hypothetical protein
MRIASPAVSCSVAVLIALTMAGIALELAVRPTPARRAVATVGGCSAGGYDWAAWAQAASH